MVNATVATVRPRPSRPLVNVPVNLTEIVRQVANEIKPKPRIREVGYKPVKPFKNNNNSNKTKICIIFLCNKCLCFFFFLELGRHWS